MVDDMDMVIRVHSVPSVGCGPIGAVISLDAGTTFDVVPVPARRSCGNAVVGLLPPSDPESIVWLEPDSEGFSGWCERVWGGLPQR